MSWKENFGPPSCPAAQGRREAGLKAVAIQEEGTMFPDGSGTSGWSSFSESGLGVGL